MSIHEVSPDHMLGGIESVFLLWFIWVRMSRAEATKLARELAEDHPPGTLPKGGTGRE